MSAHFTTPTDEMLLLAETLGEVKTKTEKLEAEFSTQARPLEAATNALSAALSGIKALQFHVLDNNLGALSARVEEMRKAVDEQVGVIALELKKADETNAAKAGQEADALRSEIAALQAQLGTLGAQFAAQLERVEFSAKEEAKKLQLIPGPAGAAGASLNPRGTFIDGETYNRLDVVSWLGSSYIAAVDGVTEKPSRNSNQWQVLASRGGGAAGGAADFGSLAGVAQINQGGTGQTTRAAGLNALLPDQAGATQYMLLTDGAGNVSWGAQPVAGLPSQTGNSGKLLTTNGTSASWTNALTGNFTFISDPATIQLWKDATPTKAARFQFNTLADNGFSLGVYDGSSWFNAITVAPTTGVVKVPSTSASTSTSSGALVVSGGVGVAGNINAGGTLSVLDGGTAASAGTIRLSNNTSIGWRNAANSADIFLTVNNSNIFSFGSGAPVYVNNTTPSTSTSSGALVVGNGTSGGLGVGGAIWAGGDITISTNTKAFYNLNYANAKGQQAGFFSRGTDGAWTAGMHFYSSNTDYSASIIHFPGTGDLQFYTNSTSSNYTSSDEALRITPAKQIQVKATTASLDTSSGALVVSGGVGVAGAIYAGGRIVVNGQNGKAAFNVSYDSSSNANTGLFLSSTGSSKGEFWAGAEKTGDAEYTARSTAANGVEFSGGAATWYANTSLTAGNTFTPTSRMVLSAAGALSVTGSFTTGAPSGGTAAAWKLGTVATVSPTSPNRTIEVDIGGTIYYIHAKTTNN